MKTTPRTNCPTPTARGTRAVGASRCARQSKRIFAPTNIHDRFCHLGLVGFGIGYFRRRFLVFHIKRRGKTKMAFIIAIAIYDGGIDVAVPTFLLGLVVWYGVLFESGLADADDILGI